MATASEKVTTRKVTKMVEVEEKVVTNITLELTVEEAAALFILVRNTPQSSDLFCKTLSPIFIALKAKGFTEKKYLGSIKTTGMDNLTVDDVYTQPYLK